MPLTDDLSKLARSANGIYNSITANATAITSMSVGGTTINASGVSGNSNIFTGNTTVNATVNSTAFTVANSTANAVVNTTGLAVGNSTVNAAVNSTAFTVGNSTVTYSYVAPTASQQSNTSFFLNANGSWAAVSSAPVISSLEAFRIGIT
jgi:hypothetical protein